MKFYLNAGDYNDDV